MEYKHTEDMGEISGFGGSYEADCQQMLHNGVTFLSNKEGVDFKIFTIKNVYGICDIRGDDAKDIEAAVMDGIDDATGAMHQAVMSRLHYINKHGWEKYCEELRKNEIENPD